MKVVAQMCARLRNYSPQRTLLLQGCKGQTQKKLNADFTDLSGL